MDPDLAHPPGDRCDLGLGKAGPMSRNGQREQGHVRDLLVDLPVIAIDEELKPQFQAIWLDDVGKGLETARIDAAQDLS